MAEKSIGSLGVIISANARKFVAGITAAAKRIGSFGNKVAAIGAKITVLGSAFGALVAGGGLAALVKSSFDSIDALAKTADKLGVTTEALRGLQIAAGLTGNKQKALNLGLQRMTRRISEAAQGSGVAKKALEELGLSAATLTTKSPDQQFLAIADAMGKVGSQTDRVRLGFKLFDSEGVGLINTLALGRKGLEEVTQEAEALGITLNRVDAAKIEASNDAVALLRDAIGGVANRIAVELAPFIEFAAKRLTEWVKIGVVQNGFVAKAFDRIKRSVGFVADAIQSLKLGWLLFRRFVSQGAVAIIGFMQDLQGAFVDVANVVNKVTGGIFQEQLDFAVAYRKALLDTAKEIYTDDVAALNAEIDRLAQSQMASKGVADGFRDIENAAEEAAKQVAANRAEISRLTATNVAAGKKEDKKKPKRERIRDAVQNVVGSGLSSAIASAGAALRFGGFLGSTDVQDRMLAEQKKTNEHLSEIRQGQLAVGVVIT